MNKKELYLHIGMPKTATTALQHFFALNLDILKTKGITYPLSGNRNAHHRLGWSIKVQYGFKKWWFDKDLHNYEEEWRVVATQLNSEKNLLSTESVWGFNERKIADVKEVTSDFHTKIVIYIRRQDAMIDSWYNELVKIGITRKSPENNDKIISLKPIDQWAKFFGADNIIIRPYEKQQFYNGTIFSDFLHHVLGLEFTDEFIVPENDANLSLHRITLEYKRMVNFISLSSFERQKILRPLQTVSTILSQKGCKNYSAFSPQQRLQIYQKFNETYEIIARDYLKRKNGRLFYDAPPDLSEVWYPYVALTQEDVQIVNELLASHHPEQLSIIVKGILYSKSSQEEEVRLAALKLLPGIPPALICEVLSNMLISQKRSKKNHQHNQLNKIYSSKTWKVGKVVNHIYQKLPEVIKQPTLSIARRLYHKAR